MTDRPTLSVCIITKDIAGFLPHVLRNVEDVADEIVVVDSFSTDGTAELLDAHPKVRLTQRAFTNFGDQKNHVFEQARCDWILSLDQDELLGDRLRAAIPDLTRTKRYTHYKLPRYWVLSGPPWRYVDSDIHYPDWAPRLFRNRPFFRFDATQIVHHHFPREGRGPRRKVKGHHVFHFDFVLRTRHERERKMQFYLALDPRPNNTHRMELYEECDFRNRLCAEPLTAPDLVANSELVASPGVPLDRR